MDEDKTALAKKQQTTIIIYLLNGIISAERFHLNPYYFPIFSFHSKHP